MYCVADSRVETGAYKYGKLSSSIVSYIRGHEAQHSSSSTADGQPLGLSESVSVSVESVTDCADLH